MAVMSHRCFGRPIECNMVRSTRVGKYGGFGRAENMGIRLATSVEGRDIGKYRVIARLGAGGMSEVFLACGRGLGGFSKLAVLKVLRANMAEDAEFVEMFLGEA